MLHPLDLPKNGTILCVEQQKWNDFSFKLNCLLPLATNYTNSTNKDLLLICVIRDIRG